MAVCFEDDRAPRMASPVHVVASKDTTDGTWLQVSFSVQLSSTGAKVDEALATALAWHGEPQQVDVQYRDEISPGIYAATAECLVIPSRSVSPAHRGHDAMVSPPFGEARRDLPVFRQELVGCVAPVASPVASPATSPTRPARGRAAHFTEEELVALGRRLAFEVKCDRDIEALADTLNGAM
jgi:hypothetical protein